MSLDDQSDIEKERLRQVVREHSVRFEVMPSQVVDGGKLCTVGYDIRLLGRHKVPVARAMPIGCKQCRETWLVLRRIATAAIPPDDRDSSYNVRQFDQSLHSDPSHHLIPEIELVVEVRHRHGYLEPVDPCETKCLKEIVNALRSLGAQGRN